MQHLTAILSTFFVLKEIERLEEKNKELICSVQKLKLTQKGVKERIFEDVFTKPDKYVVWQSILYAFHKHCILCQGEFVWQKMTALTKLPSFFSCSNIFPPFSPFLLLLTYPWDQNWTSLAISHKTSWQSGRCRKLLDCLLLWEWLLDSSSICCPVKWKGTFATLGSRLSQGPFSELFTNTLKSSSLKKSLLIFFINNMNYFSCKENNLYREKYMCLFHHSSVIYV